MEKIWLKKYDPGVPRSIDMSQYHSLVEVLNENFKNYSNETAYINGTGSITYRQVNHSSCALAHFLVSKCSLAKGDRVAIMMPNLLQYPVSIFAIHRAGLVVVNIYPMHQPEIIEQILKKSGAKCLIILNDLLETVENIIDNTDVKNVIVTQKDDLFSKINSFGLNFWHYFKSKKINSNIKCKKHHFNSALTIINCILFRQSNVVGSDIAFIQFKGMTEKSLRGVVLTHKNVLANSQQITLWTDTFFKRKFRGVIVSVPMSFMLSALTGCYIFFRVGGTHILITDPNNIQNLIDEIKHYPFSTIIGYSRFFKNLLKNENFKEIDFSMIKYVFSSGGTIQESVVHKWDQTTHSALLNSYGLAEATGVITLDPLTKRWFDGSVGLPLPSTDIKICDENGNELPIGERGELWVNGPQVMKEYWNDPELTKETLTQDGWLKTGDLASIDQDGYVHVFDRISDVIMIDNRMILPNEIEEVIAEIPEVEEVAITGQKDESGHVKIKAFIICQDKITKESILEYCKKYLKPECIPHEIEFRTKLEKSFTGRYFRNEIK